MPDAPWTLSQFFFGAGRSIGARGARKVEKDTALQDLREQISEELPKLAWKPVARQLGQKIVESLDFGVAERILGPAWQKLEVLQQYRDPEEFPPEETVLVPIAEHTVTSSHSPHVEIRLKEFEVGRLDLSVDLELELKGVLLEVRGGVIRRIQAGSCLGRGRLACHFRGKEVWKVERESRQIEFEQGVALGDGIPIPATGSDDGAIPPGESA